jgi:glycosyltransferase involved in cell wall biosynthesis
MKDYPLVSVLMLVYNHEKYIREAIQSVLDQETDFPFEIVIGEDCSTDLTRDIVFRFQRNHPDKIKVITSDKNVGMRQNEFRTLNATRGKYIAYCEGDDYWCDSRKLQKQVEIMESNPSITLCFHAVSNKLVNSSKRDKIIRSSTRNRFYSTDEVILKGGGFYKLVSAMVSRSIFTELPDWYLQFPVGDIALGILAAIRGEVFYLNEVMAVYRSGVQGSWSQRNAQRIQSNQDHQLKLIEARIIVDRQTNFVYHRAIKRRNSENLRNLLLNNRLEDVRRSLIIERYFNQLSDLDKYVVSIIVHTKAFWIWKIKLSISTFLK